MVKLKEWTEGKDGGQRVSERGEKDESERGKMGESLEERRDGKRQMGRGRRE